jgi:hypothetical protein
MRLLGSAPDGGMLARALTCGRIALGDGVARAGAPDLALAA